MTRPTAFSIPWPQGVGIPGGDPSLPEGQPPVDCCDDDAEIPDRALDQTVFIGATGGDATLVQDKSAAFSSGTSLTYDTDPIAGNLLVAAIANSGPTAHAAPAGWTLVTTAGASGYPTAMWYRAAPGGSVTVTISAGTAGRLRIMEFDGFAALVDETTDGGTWPGPGGAGTGVFTVGDVTFGGGVLVGIVAAGDPGGGGQTDYVEDATFTEIDQGSVGAGNPPESIVGYDVAGAGTYDRSPTGSTSAGGHPSWGGILAAFEIDDGWIGAGPNITDGDDDTCQEISGPNVIRIDLGDAFGIARIRLVIGTETAGAKSYTLKGANEADFSDAVTVATISWTATGSFTDDVVTDSWVVADDYQFWELTGDDETRNVCSFELFEASMAVDITGVQADIDNHIADPADAHDASAVSVLDTAGWFAATDVEAALAEMGGKVVGYLAHGNMGAAETFDAGTGWHSGTFDANCTLTLTGATSGLAAQMLLELAQNGTGGWTITLPASVSNKAQLEADQDTTLSTTSFLILMTRDGGTTWYGFWAGGIHPAAAGGTGIGPLLIDSAHSVPIVFGDILQASDGSDLLYASAP